MPSYALPPWIQAADPAAQFLSGIRTGATIGEAQARLAQEQEEARMRAQARQEQLAADILQAKTRLDYENAYHQQSLDLEKQKLKDLEQKNAAAMADTIGFATYLKANPGDVLGGLMKFPNVYSQHLRAVESSQPFSPEEKTLPGGTKVVSLGPRRYQVLDKPSQLTGEKKVEDEALKAQISELYKAINSRDYLPEEKASFKKQIEDLVEKRKAFYRQPMPMPKSATEQYEPGMLNPLPPVLPSAPVAPVSAQIGAPVAPMVAVPTKQKRTVKEKVARANELAKEHPDWTKAKILAAVEAESE